MGNHSGLAHVGCDISGEAQARNRCLLSWCVLSIHCDARGALLVSSSINEGCHATANGIDIRSILQISSLSQTLLICLKFAECLRSPSNIVLCQFYNDSGPVGTPVVFCLSNTIFGPHYEFMTEQSNLQLRSLYLRRGAQVNGSCLSMFDF